jgi:hypothetical protein
VAMGTLSGLQEGAMALGARRSTPFLKQQPQVLELLQLGWFAISIGHHINAVEVYMPLLDASYTDCQ